MKQYLDALKNREEVPQEILEELEERFKEPIEEPVEVIPVPTEIELLQEENNKLKTKLYEIESITTETSATQELLIELLLDMGVM